ncbi:MAG: hypothetical protein ACI9IT_002422 [Glaciecola sp.]|jgi:hypothetical protein
MADFNVSITSVSSGINGGNNAVARSINNQLNYTLIAVVQNVSRLLAEN